MKENGKAREISTLYKALLYIRKQSGGKPQYRGAGISGDWTKKSESGYETITGNIALNKTASASGVEAAMPNLTANLAVDGQKSDTSRWSAPTMKNGTSPNQQQTPQWLEIDLRNEVTNITSIDL